MTITATEAQARLTRLIEQVNDHHAAVEITSSKGTAYLVSERRVPIPARDDPPAAVPAKRRAATQEPR